MRLKRNNFVKNHENILNDEFMIKNFLPKFEQILIDNKEFLNDISSGHKEVIEISSYMPIAYEMHISPVMDKIL
jgi:hypothetical protein